MANIWCFPRAESPPPPQFPAPIPSPLLESGRIESSTNFGDVSAPTESCTAVTLSVSVCDRFARCQSTRRHHRVTGVGQLHQVNTWGSASYLPTLCDPNPTLNTIAISCVLPSILTNRCSSPLSGPSQRLKHAGFNQPASFHPSVDARISLRQSDKTRSIPSEYLRFRNRDGTGSFRATPPALPAPSLSHPCFFPRSSQGSTLPRGTVADECSTRICRFKDRNLELGNPNQTTPEAYLKPNRYERPISSPKVVNPQEARGNQIEDLPQRRSVISMPTALLAISLDVFLDGRFLSRER